MSCESENPTAGNTATAPKLITLKEAIDRDGVPPTFSMKQRRLMDVHVTAYPGLVNERVMPKHETQATDFSPIDPLQYRKAHAVRNNNATSERDKEENVLDMLTTKQFSSYMTKVGLEMRQEHIKHPENKSLLNSLYPRGYHSRFLAPGFDERSTYRWDYCQGEGAGFRDTVRRERLATYRDDWTEDEKSDVATSMKVPYLTMPVSSDRLKDQTTVYRKQLMPTAQQTDYRSLSHKVDLAGLDTNYAYSAYTIDDPRREIRYDASVAAFKHPHSVLEKTFSPRNSFIQKSESSKMNSAAREELDRLRTLRRETMRVSAANRFGYSADASRTESTANAVVIPGMKGCGYRRAPKDNNDYVYLPRDHFCHQTVEDL